MIPEMAYTIYDRTGVDAPSGPSQSVHVMGESYERSIRMSVHYREAVYYARSDPGVVNSSDAAPQDAFDDAVVNLRA